ncbi:DJ-1/PfpI family protein [Aquisalimonas sp.]|uniref:DJ-1/PfpI family protein n=1 Tax=Aquisalimonas sp. TaxID=1872621 RepID=UPI0025C160E2|nr:DJ-1/PfpI family protein [Aquisalimonas sp.]
MQIAIVVYPGLTALDAVGPYEVLRFTDHEIRFVAAQPGPVVADSGVLVLGATHGFDETPAPDLVIVPGSEANTATAMADGALIRWLRRAHETSQWTVSVCSGALILGAAGILDGHPATTHWVAQDKLAAFSARACRNQRVVRSGKIATAAGVSAGIDLALWLVGELCGAHRAREIQLLIEYDPQPPYDAGHPDKAPSATTDAAREEMLRRARNPRNALSIPTVAWRRMLASLRRRL